MAHAERYSDACYNCGTALNGPFCGACGQKSQQLDPSLADFLHDLSHELLHVDGKIFRSVATLLLRPGVLTRDYFDGKKARWVSPIRLYLVFSVLFFAVIALGDPQSEEISHTTSRLMVALLPVFAWLVSRVTVERRHLPQHLYFALHVHAAWYVAWTIREGGGELLSPRFMGSTRWLGWLMMTYMFLYAILACRTAYREKLWKAALKMTGVLAAYLLVVSLAALALAFIH
jgi:uncharacterized protein DUF3667